MDPTTAHALFQQGAVVVVLDMPVGTEFGIDYNSWNVGIKFKGVKMVPPGVHFLFTSATDMGAESTDDLDRLRRRPQTGPRTGLFRVLSMRELVVYRWDPHVEDLVEMALTDDEKTPFRANLHELDQFLGPYPFDQSLKRWLSLTTCISKVVVDRVSPRSGKIASVTVHQEGGANSTSPAAMDVSTDAPITFDELRWAPDAESACRFTLIPTLPVGAGPDLRTRWNVDKSLALHTMLAAVDNRAFGTFCGFWACLCLFFTWGEKREGGEKSWLTGLFWRTEFDQLLGELQFAFVTFIVGQVFDGFEHWKKLVNVLCNCDEAMLQHPKLFLDFIGISVRPFIHTCHLQTDGTGVLHFQLRETPQDFFVDIVSQNNFLTTTLQVFFV
jgi:A1 cistron-splicing factor AAR2